MAMTQREKAALDDHITRESWDDVPSNPRKLFDVTCVIGSVYDDPSSPITAHEAAFVMVAKHDAPGTFSWTDDHGYAYSVTVERQDPPKDSTTTEAY